MRVVKWLILARDTYSYNEKSIEKFFTELFCLPYLISHRIYYIFSQYCFVLISICILFWFISYGIKSELIYLLKHYCFSKNNWIKTPFTRKHNLFVLQQLIFKLSVSNEKLWVLKLFIKHVCASNCDKQPILNISLM